MAIRTVQFCQSTVMQAHGTSAPVMQRARNFGSCLAFCIHYAKAVMGGTHQASRILGALKDKANQIMRDQTDASIDLVFQGQTYLRKLVNKHGLEFQEITADDDLSNYTVAAHTMALHTFYFSYTDQQGKPKRGAHAILHTRYGDDTVQVFEPNHGCYSVTADEWRSWTKNVARHYGTNDGHVFMEISKPA